MGEAGQLVALGQLLDFVDIKAKDVVPLGREQTPCDAQYEGRLGFGGSPAPRGFCNVDCFRGIELANIECALAPNLPRFTGKGEELCVLRWIQDMSFRHDRCVFIASSLLYLFKN